MTENQETQVKLTKPKSEGRVAAGKKLAEWNKQNKAKLKSEEPGVAQELDVKSSQVVDTSNLSSGSSENSSTSASHSSALKSSHVLVFLAGIAAFFGFAYVWRKQGAAQSSSDVVKAEPEKPKIFDPWR